MFIKLLTLITALFVGGGLSRFKRLYGGQVHGKGSGYAVGVSSRLSEEAGCKRQNKRNKKGD